MAFKYRRCLGSSEISSEEDVSELHTVVGFWLDAELGLSASEEDE